MITANNDPEGPLILVLQHTVKRRRYICSLLDAARAEYLAQERAARRSGPLWTTDPLPVPTAAHEALLRATDVRDVTFDRFWGWDSIFQLLQPLTRVSPALRQATAWQPIPASGIRDLGALETPRLHNVEDEQSLCRSDPQYETSDLSNTSLSQLGSSKPR
jgi:hypothetical protein